MSEDKQYRCVLPFSHLNIMARGVVSPCCNYEWRNSPHWKEAEVDISKFTWISEGMENILHSKPWFELRKKSQKNIPEPGCSNCYFSDKTIGSSRRTWANNVFPDADNETKLKSIELKLGAKCNLECRTCSYTSSNKLLREFSYRDFGKVDKDWVRRVQSFSDWTKDPAFWDDLKSVSHDLEYIQFTGGEPLLIYEQYEYLQWLVDNNILPTIQYITNGTQGLDDHKRALWDNFSSLIIDLSIDGTQEVGEYVRTGSVWSEQHRIIKEYVDYFKERYAKYPKKSYTNELNLATTVSILNVTEIRSVLDFMYDVGMENSSWSINIVRQEPWLDIANLTGEPQQYALDVINEIAQDEKYSAEHRNKLNEITERLKCEPTTSAEFSVSLKEKERVHNIVNPNRQHCYAEVLPDWWDMLVKHNI